MSYSSSGSRKDEKSSSTSQQGQTQGGYTKKESFAAAEPLAREKSKEPPVKKVADDYNSGFGKRKNWGRKEFAEQRDSQLENSSAKKRLNQPMPEKKKFVELSKEEDVPKKTKYWLSQTILK